MAERYATRGLRVIGIHEINRGDHDERARVDRMLGEKNAHHPTYLDADGEYRDRLGASRLPGFYIVGRDGKVRYSYHGTLVSGSDGAREVEREIRRALDERS